MDEVEWRRSGGERTGVERSTIGALHVSIRITLFYFRYAPQCVTHSTHSTPSRFLC